MIETWDSVWKSKKHEAISTNFVYFGSNMLKTKRWNHVFYGFSQFEFSKTESIYRKVGKKLRRPAPHAFIKHCGTKSAPIAPPNTLTGSYTQFLPKAYSYLKLLTRTSKSKPYFGTLPKYTDLIYWWIVYAILLLCWNTTCFITLWSYTQHLYISELCPILTHCWGIPYLDTLLSNSPFQYIAELYPILTHRWGISNPNTLLRYSQHYYIAELWPILIHCRTIINFDILLSDFAKRCREPIRIEY